MCCMKFYLVVLRSFPCMQVKVISLYSVVRYVTALMHISWCCDQLRLKSSEFTPHPSLFGRGVLRKRSLSEVVTEEKCIG